jgi:hypothetical protein
MAHAIAAAAAVREDDDDDDDGSTASVCSAGSACRAIQARFIRIGSCPFCAHCQKQQKTAAALFQHSPCTTCGRQLGCWNSSLDQCERCYEERQVCTIICEGCNSSVRMRRDRSAFTVFRGLQLCSVCFVKAVQGSTEHHAHCVDCGHEFRLPTLQKNDGSRCKRCFLKKLT